MEEEEVNEIFLSGDLQSILAPDERKHAAHFEKEGLDLRQNCLLKLPLSMFVGEFQKVERVLVFYRKFRLVAYVLWQCLVEARLIQPCLLVGSILDLMDQHVLGPTEPLRPPEVKLTLA